MTGGNKSARNILFQKTIFFNNNKIKDLYKGSEWDVDNKLLTDK